MQPGEDKIVFDNGLVLHRLQCLRMFGDWINSIVDFGLSLTRMTLDISSLACMAALSMVTCKYIPAFLYLLLYSETLSAGTPSTGFITEAIYWFLNQHYRHYGLILAQCLCRTTDNSTCSMVQRTDDQV